MSDQDILPNDRSAAATAAGGETTIPVDFPIYDQAEIMVTRTRAGVTVTLALASDYTVSGAGGPDFSVVLVIPAAADDVYTIDGATTIVRTGEYSQSNFKAFAVNRELDRATMIAQETRRDVDRSLESDVSAAQSASDAAASANRAALERRRATAQAQFAAGHANKAETHALQILTLAATDDQIMLRSQVFS